jgi:uncharacterized membrane protein YgcG
MFRRKNKKPTSNSSYSSSPSVNTTPDTLNQMLMTNMILSNTDSYSDSHSSYSDSGGSCDCGGGDSGGGCGGSD